MSGVHENGSMEADNHTELHEQYVFNVIMGIWIPGMICTVGIIGNTLALIVLTKDNRCPSLYSMRGLAASDLTLLVFAMLQQVIPLQCHWSNSVSTFCRHQGYIRLYTWPIICMAQLMTIWMTILISFERYVAICHPLKAMRLRTLSRVRFIMFTIVVISVILNIPKFFEFDVKRELIAEQNLTQVVLDFDTYLRNNKTYRYFYNTAFHCLVVYAFPLPTLCFLNFKLVRKLHRLKHQWENLNILQQKELKATILPLCIVIIFFICSTQSLIAFVLDAIYINIPGWLSVYTATVNIIVVLNSAINFLLMYIFGRKFRRLLKGLCQPRYLQRRDTPHNSINLIRTSFT